MNKITSKIGITFNPVKCPICHQEQPYIRKPKGLYEILWGGYTCKNCGCRMDKYGRKRD